MVFEQNFCADLASSNSLLPYGIQNSQRQREDNNELYIYEEKCKHFYNHSPKAAELLYAKEILVPL